MRQLTDQEQLKLKALTAYSVPLTLIEPTRTGLEKSIMDATGPVRQFLLDTNLHNFQDQGQGQEHKVQIDSQFILEGSNEQSNASLYRPTTKDGDPRIWFSGLKKHAAPNDVLALIAYEGVIYVVNLTQLPVEELLAAASLNPLKELAAAIQTEDGAIAAELLLRLKKIGALGPVRAELAADTAVGRTLETLLGITINSSRQPDYKGIELKAFRRSKGNRKNLFAQVPDWSLSKLKGSGEILDQFGYERGVDFKLYCTVSCLGPNSQGLMLRIDNDDRLLHENSNKPLIGDFAVWTLTKLHERLLEKHNETFWIAAESLREDGVEYLHYTKVEHTRKPIVSQFDLLLEQGIITLDHLIKRKPSRNTVEKGPLFKIKPNSVGLLFPPSRSYSLY
ncbi:MAG: MvaI/BcnI restriction endonuclease family protein [Flavobacteriales bacterium]|nr:MvaI/BcnI restriction endonuclease family protein [Flavobacteriales bacterium]